MNVSSPPFATGFLIAVLSAGFASPGQAANAERSATAPANAAIDDKAASEPVARQGMQDAVASVVVVALTEQFDGKAVSVDIDTYDVEVSGARERIVSGQGTVRIGGDGPMSAIAFRYRTLYDVVASNAGYPSISIDKLGSGAERSVPNDSVLISSLDERVGSALERELGDQQVWLQFNEIESFESGDRYVRISATGLADFGVDGSSPVRVEAMYDRAANAWLRLNYELGSQFGAEGLSAR